MPNREMLENRKHSTAYIPYSFYECRIPEFYLNVPMHWHDEFEINRILRGRGEFICGDDKLTVWKKRRSRFFRLYIACCIQSGKGGKAA